MIKVLDGSFLWGIQEYIALFDLGNIVSISANIFSFPPQGHPILYNYLKGYMDHYQ